MLLVMLSRPDFTNAAKPRHGIPDPVLALQMAHDLADVDAVLSDAPSLDREVMRVKQYEDFGFIASYAALYFVSALLLVRTYPALRWIRMSALIAAIAGTAAAALDVTENFAILRILDVPLAATTQSMIDAIHVTAMFKWALGFLALALLSTWFFRDSRLTSRAVGAIYLAAALVGAYGLIDNAVLVLGAGLILLGLLGAVIVFLLLP
jgi:hypothetical protein